MATPQNCIYSDTMDRYNIDQYLDTLYSVYPEAPQRPIIGITANFANGDITLRNHYCEQIANAGGVAVVIPPLNNTDVIVNTLDNIDGLLLSGGADINPLWVGEQPSPLLHNINPQRDLPELLTVRLAYNRQLPILGICRGCQTLAMALNGHVAQDISERKDACGNASSVCHSQDAPQQEPTHSVSILPNTILSRIYEREKIYVNSFHHQVVDDCGPRFVVSARAEDGVIEAIESCEHRAILGVQWHPEWLGNDGLPLFKWLVDEAQLFSKAKDVHRRVLTLDSHCDTPMLFPQGIDFAKRDSRILVDLHKMSDGHQDAVTMAAYIPQTYEGSAFEYADSIFNRLDAIIADNHRFVAKANTIAELYANKQSGLRSIMYAIENGKALEGNIRNVEYFANRGIVYITLCHNGDNDLCDSARGSQTWGGVSEFGEEVIMEMNRLGVLVDLSHAAESSFYDALQISHHPVVCSHSSCRALCDHPRNLTDDQMRALAAKDGVCQITFYHGFLKQTGEASIIDGINHLNHAVNIMGIDHVGIGTDFDGDGGVKGMEDSSQMINFTKHLLRQRYSEEDITKLWGKNWLRTVRKN